MTSNNLLEKYIPKAEAAAKRPPDEPGVFDDFVAFGHLRGMQDRALMLELRSADGNRVAFAYAHLASATLDPSVGISLQFGGRKVAISGSNLNAELKPNVRLYESILRFRVPWIQETGHQALQLAKPGAVVIDSIEIEP